MNKTDYKKALGGLYAGKVGQCVVVDVPAM